MTTEFLTNEMLSAEQLDLVAGGSDIQNAEDVLFFYELGYDVASTELKDAFAKNGVKFSDRSDNNSYKILTGNGEWTQHPHFAALGYVLSKSLITAEKILRLRSEDFFIDCRKNF
ncbi:MAG: hypothetical protein IKO05_01295 [Selenomonadaceae bacterium]|nr:hypothetical protein [Selenomonadaceae bacterium]